MGKRAADDDRAGIADQLRAALDEGRLVLHEYDDRLQRAYAAKTYAELEELVHDLPAAPSDLRPVSQVRPSGPPLPYGSGTASWKRIALIAAVAAIAAFIAFAWSFLS